MSPLSSQAISHWGSPLAAVDAVDLPTRTKSCAARPLSESAQTLEEPEIRRRIHPLRHNRSAWRFSRPLIARYNPDAIDYNALNQNPTSAHWLGADYLGRDMWSRLVWGARTSLVAGIWW